MTTKPARRPGDYILDKYCPNLNPAEREEARERLQKLARLLVRIAMRQVREEQAVRGASLTAHGTQGTLWR